MGTKIAKAIIILSVVLVVIAVAQRCAAEEHYGISIMAGFNAETGDRHPNITYLGIFPQRTHRFHEYIGLQLENEFSIHMIEGKRDSYHLGGNTNILFFLLEDFSLYLGAGIGWNNGETYGLGGSHVGGVLQAGFQFTYPISKGYELAGNYRFHHTSDPLTNKDGGINTHIFSFGIRW